MASLVEGQSYGLSSQDSSTSLTNNHQKSVIHVKLTDSALKALELFQQSKGKIKGKNASIQFLGNQGEICVPGLAQDGEVHRFQFSMSSAQMDSKDSFECVAESRDRMSVVGTIANKLTVLAKEDVYEATKERFSQAEEESKKNCTKEIKPSTSARGHSRIIKKVVRPSTLPNSQNFRKPPISAPSSSHSRHHSASPVQGSQPRRSSPSSLNRSSPSIAPNFTSGNDRKSSVVSSRPVTSPVVESAPTTVGTTSSLFMPRGRMSSFTPVGTSSTRHGTKETKEGPVVGVTASLPNSQSTESLFKPIGNSSAINFPYRDRVIHLLALRPYTKPELLLRLQKDGIREKDKNLLTSTLQQVAHLNPRDNRYTLARHLWSDVRTDWPLYTEENRTEILRKCGRSSESISPVSDCSAISPLHSSSSQGSPLQQSQKRAIVNYCDLGLASTAIAPSTDVQSYSEPSNKKQRVAHNKAPRPPPPPTLTPLLHTSNSNLTPPHDTQNAPHPFETGGCVDPSQGPFSMFSSSKLSHKSDDAVVVAGTLSPTEDASVKSHEQDFVVVDSPPYSQENIETLPTNSTDIPNYVLAYPPLTTADQRRRYKTEFNADFSEYCELHAEMSKHAKLFREFERELKNVSGDELESIRRRVVDAYAAIKSQKYVERRARCEYLTHKLSHIKRCVEEFDSSQTRLAK